MYVAVCTIMALYVNFEFLHCCVYVTVCVCLCVPWGVVGCRMVTKWSYKAMCHLLNNNIQKCQTNIHHCCRQLCHGHMQQHVRTFLCLRPDIPIYVAETVHVHLLN